ncbi:HupE/UreJ family protein [Verrucomicrobiaceae bacterium 5K15]|uniref:HupE/UreJ family protein n=1 Tax=Oceaniferula flava TaxID=2800421 RepID=A0AAE2SBV9_9BACT|nr:HupE/UreJ family protein [Oceaniferula flavus]MBK1854079.1 HupE/UreJ family protein [Oceaniferula flavus]MBM1135385.1 HupE/UreJ family protein [Oceaniferula flavus]
MKVALLLLLLCGGLQAHVVEQLFADFSRSEKSWSLKLRFDAGLALPEMRQDKNTPQPKRAWLLSRTPSQLADMKRETEQYLHTYLQPSWVFSEGGKIERLAFDCSFPAWQTSPPSFTPRFTDTGCAYYDVIITGNIPAEAGELRLFIPDGNHPDLAIGFDNGTILTAYPRKSLTLINRSNTAPTESDSFLNFLDYGYRHVIPEGWDHVLFILALVCLTFAWKPLLSQSLIFTVGHTITLGLVVTGTVSTPDDNWMKWIEVLIAATILYVAVENILSQKVRAHRLLMIFVFGLIHGLGFASVLGDKIRAATDITLPLTAANLGVELGQITVIGVTLLALYWAREKKFFPTLLKGLSAIIALTASYWVIERVLG